MWDYKFQEHLNDSSYCNSKYDGFDRGDLDFEDYSYPDIGQKVIGRITVEKGFRIEIIESWCDDLKDYEVRINNRRVFGDCDDKQKAITVAKWWLNGCPC